MSATKTVPSSNLILTDNQLNEVIAFIKHGGITEIDRVLKIEDDKVKLRFDTTMGFSYYAQFYSAIEDGMRVTYIYVDVAIAQLLDEPLRRKVALLVTEQAINCPYPQRAALNKELLSLQFRAPMSYLNDLQIKQILLDTSDVAGSLFNVIKNRYPVVLPFFNKKTEIH